MILNIETSSKKCSVALCEDGVVRFFLESESDMDHATKLAPFVERCMKELKLRELSLDAVAVSMGPGSYTGLRIGLSLAKGLCFSLGIPLIGVSTLETLAVKAMFSSFDAPDDELYIPMIDARRMEIYTAVYDKSLKPLMAPAPWIIDENSYMEYSGRSITMIGDGVEKSLATIKIPVREKIFGMPTAADMTALSEKAYREQKFLDIAYSTPEYLKNFMATTPKNKLNL